VTIFSELVAEWQGVFFVDAGGDCSVAIRVTRGSVLSTGMLAVFCPAFSALLV
jgi:hypothetical protein